MGHTFYAVMNFKNEIGKKRSVRMHQFLLGVRGRENGVDHINHNGLDNRRKNLRLASQSNNVKNSSKSNKDGLTSLFKGVCQKEDGKWLFQIVINGRKIRGTYDSEIKAAFVYNFWAKKLFGEFACLNKLASFKEEFFIPKIGMKTNDCLLRGIGDKDGFQCAGYIDYVGEDYFILRNIVNRSVFLISELYYVTIQNT